MAATWMRVGLRRIAAQMVRSGKLGWVFRQGIKFPLVWAGSRWNLTPLSGPVLAGLCLTHRCNERCLMCDLPFRPASERRQELTSDEWFTVVDDIAADGGGAVNLTGGEPLLRSDLPAIVGRIRARGLPVSVNSNALLLNNAHVRGPFLDVPPSALNISLDGADAATYDHLRGLPGGFKTLLAAIDVLMREREQRGVTMALNAVCVLSPRTLPHVRAIVGLAESLGFDSIGFLPIEEIPSVNPLYPQQLEALWTSDAKAAQVEAVVEALEWLLERQVRGTGLPLENSRAYLESLPLAFMGRESPSACVTGHINTFVGPYGDVYPCWPFQEWKRPPIGNLRETPFRELWRSRQYAESREETRRCRACFWDCHLEENILFDPPRINGVREAKRMLSARQAGAPTRVAAGGG